MPYMTFAAAAATAKSLQSCPTLWDPIDGSPPGSTVPGILQARTLEWVAIAFSNAWKWKVKVKSLSRVRPSATPWTAAYQAPPSMGFSRQEYWSGVPLRSPIWCLRHQFPLEGLVRKSLSGLRILIWAAVLLHTSFPPELHTIILKCLIPSLPLMSLFHSDVLSSAGSHKNFYLAKKSLWHSQNSVGKESACNAGNPVSIPGSARYSGEVNGNLLQYSCLGNPMDRGDGRLQSMGSQESDTT